jgi:hypothetical protein
VSETAACKTFVKNIRPYGLLYPIETPGVKGRPDYAYALRYQKRTTEGWTEIKWLEKWPKRVSTSVCVASLKLEQVLWHEKHHALGGRVSTLLQVGRSTFLLLTAPVLRLLFERKLTTAELIMQARVYSADGFPTIEILKALTL